MYANTSFPVVASKAWSMPSLAPTYSIGVRLMWLCMKVRYDAGSHGPLGAPTYTGELSTISPSLCVRLRNGPPLRISLAELPRRYSSTSWPLVSPVKVSSSAPSAVEEAMPLVAVVLVFQWNGMPWEVTGSHVVINLSGLYQCCASSCACACHRAAE